VACTVYDLRASTRSVSGPPTAQYVNVVLGVLAAIGISLTVFKSPQQAVVAFGAWPSLLDLRNSQSAPLAGAGNSWAVSGR
jgi:hypothetical protein